jgi:hypothetical protein
MPETHIPAPDLSGLSLAEIAKAASERRLPPVDQWDPERHGDSRMRIARDGRWYHEGGPIDRMAMVRLFASLLRREKDGRHVLVTPAERLDIVVEDAPFVAVEVKSEGEGPARRLAFRLNTDETVIADADHPLRFAAKDGQSQPYVRVRGGLEALIARSVYYEIASLAIDEGADPPGLWSGGAFFPFPLDT